MIAFGLIDLSERCWIEVSGEDSQKFLNGILTNNIQTLKENTGCYAAICTPKGKMIADLFCYHCGNFLGIDCSKRLKPTILETLKKYIIFQKVVLQDQTEKWGVCAVIGSKAAEFLREKIATSTPRVFPKKIWGLDGFELWTHRDQLLPFKTKLSLPELSQETQEILRIESATPLFGIDMDENTIPQEANLYSALSFNKGCYVGQEVIARLEHRGHVGKKLVLLKIEWEQIPKAGEKILTTDGTEAGWITSACFSPKHKGVIALAYIKYQYISKPLRHAHPLEPCATSF